MAEADPRRPSSLSTRVFVRLARWAYRGELRGAARAAMEGRRIDPADVEAGRWLRADVQHFLADLWRRVDVLLPVARLEDLPTWGNRHNVFLAVVTTAAYQVLRARGVEREVAMELVADVGWKVYARMLALASLPFRTIGDRQVRMERTLRALMVFPFSAPGRPGYEVTTRRDADGFHTDWTHCPPQTFVRKLVGAGPDDGELDAFRRSWCRYDWAAADVLAADGQRGHYERPHTLSRGDAVCDMCWHARACGVEPQPSAEEAAE